tara:strand:+ start:869 stop:1156 length:288 start_codon:yes stop_codon:yes gene_type:complete
MIGIPTKFLTVPFLMTLTMCTAPVTHPPAQAHMGHSFPTGEWIRKLREHESRQKRTSTEDTINNAIGDFIWEDEEYGNNGSAKSEELLQLPSDRD